MLLSRTDLIDTSEKNVLFLYEMEPQAAFKIQERLV